MRAFNSSPQVKQKYLERVLGHKIEGKIRQRSGSYSLCGYKGAIGVTVHSDDPNDYEAHLGIPACLAVIEETIFDMLPEGMAQEWPGLFLSTIGTGADLSRVWLHFMPYLLDDPIDGVIQFAKVDDVRSAIQRIAQLYREGCIDSQEWCKAVFAAQQANGVAAKLQGVEGAGATLATCVAFTAGWTAAGVSLAHEMKMSDHRAMLHVGEVVQTACKTFGVVAEAEVNVNGRVNKESWIDSARKAAREEEIAIKAACVRQSGQLIKLLSAA